MKIKYIKEYSLKALKMLRITCVILLPMLVFTACSEDKTTIDALLITDGQVLSDQTAFDSEKENGKAEMTVAESADDEKPVDEETATEELLCVYVCGAVCNPGVVYVEVGSRAERALELAGGFADGANTVYVNLAAKVADGQRLYIPYLEDEQNHEMEEPSVSGNNGTDSEAMYPVNINTADISSLCSIPGIGETRAKAIIEYRNTYGLFEIPEDIKNVSGIGEASYNKMAAYICVK